MHQTIFAVMQAFGFLTVSAFVKDPEVIELGGRCLTDLVDCRHHMADQFCILHDVVYELEAQISKMKIGNR